MLSDARSSLKGYFVMRKMCVVTTVESTMNWFIIPAMREMKKQGYEITLVCNMSEAFIEKYSKEFRCYNIKMKSGISIQDLVIVPLKLYKFFKREKFDYVQYATSNAAFYSSIASFFSKIPIRLYCQWGILYADQQGFKRHIYKDIVKLTCRMSTNISCASFKNLEISVNDGLYPREKATVVGDGGTIGIDLTQFDVSKRDEYKQEVLLEHPQLKEKFVYAYLGRIVREKGINELLNAYYCVKKDNMAVLFIGDNIGIEQVLEPALYKKVKEDPSVVFHGYTSNVAKYLSVVDVLVHPTYKEGFSMAIQQAMSMGCGIITTDIPGPSEVIVENQCGLLVPAKDYVRLSEAMCRLYSDRKLLDSFVEYGIRRVHDRFSRQRMLQCTIEDREKIFRDKGLI